MSRISNINRGAGTSPPELKSRWAGASASLKTERTVTLHYDADFSLVKLAHALKLVGCQIKYRNGRYVVVQT